MASPIEEYFVEKNLRGKTVFEFGSAPGKLANRLASNGYSVVGVDLYDNDEFGGYNFVNVNFMDYKTSEKFDNVIAVSSIEHCGIESADFKDGDKRDLSYHYFVADKMSKMIGYDNQLIVTVPFGKDNVYYVDSVGNNGTDSEIPSPAWGFRTFTRDSIQKLFVKLELVKCDIYDKIGQDYFNLDSWRMVINPDPERYNNKNRAVMCCIFRGRRSDMGFGDGISWEKHVDENIAEHGSDGKMFYGDMSEHAFADTKSFIKTDTAQKEWKALDCGCHMGRFIDTVRSYGFDYTGVDQCQKALDYAKENRPDGNWVYSFLWDMKFNEEFDFAFTNAVLQHNLLEEQERIIPRIYASLKPGGVFMMTESTEPIHTRTQRTYVGWINMVEKYGFKFVKSFHKNPKGYDDKYIFIKEK